MPLQKDFFSVCLCCENINTSMVLKKEINGSWSTLSIVKMIIIHGTADDTLFKKNVFYSLYKLKMSDVSTFCTFMSKADESATIFLSLGPLSSNINNV